MGSKQLFVALPALLILCTEKYRREGWRNRQKIVFFSASTRLDATRL